MSERISTHLFVVSRVVALSFSAEEEEEEEEEEEVTRKIFFLKKEKDDLSTDSQATNTCM